jgi:aerobic-type carbon monoxide dehydrogenase small subunit (CoxS/CutS family)
MQEEAMAQTYDLVVNGEKKRVSADPDTPLLYLLKNDLELKGPRFGCGLAQCGSCSILVDGVETRSCITPVSAIGDRAVTTLEGLTKWYAEKKKLDKVPELHPVQQAFIDEQAMQCGYCYNGQTIKAAELLSNNPKPTDKQIREAMDGHLCRCGTYQRINKSIKLASARMAGG